MEAEDDVTVYAGGYTDGFEVALLQMKDSYINTFPLINRYVIKERCFGFFYSLGGL